MADKDIFNEARKFYTGIGKTRDYERAYSMLLPWRGISGGRSSHWIDELIG